MTPDPIFWAALYGLGVLVGLARTDAGPAARVGLALLWPIGPVAFVVTVAGLLVTVAIAKAAGAAQILRGQRVG